MTRHFLFAALATTAGLSLTACSKAQVEGIAVGRPHYWIAFEIEPLAWSSFLELVVSPLR